ncbi:MAG: signal peptidase I [Alistipes sp.]|nr:signal peptidase I [Candidatus Minthomonas equi]
MKFWQNKWFKFGFWALLYVLWVIWLGNFWWLIGLAVVFDLHITKKVKWAFWKKEYKDGEPHSTWNEWLDAIIFAVIVVTFINIFFIQAYQIPSSSMEKTLMTGDHLFVSKLAYGPKLPERPLSMPFMHNVFPGTQVKCYSDFIKKGYRRLAGFGKVERDDIVVFGFPDGDTVLSKIPVEDYYTHSRIEGREYAIETYGPILVRPVDKKDNYVKRCVAIAGDTLSVVDGQVIVNGVPQKSFPGIQMTYSVRTTGQPINQKILQDLGLNPSDYWFDSRMPGYPYLPLSAADIEVLSKLPIVSEMVPNIDVFPPDYPDSQSMLFPFSSSFQWTRDNYGPLWIPAKGSSVTLTPENIPLYRRIISVYEGHELTESEDGFFIDGERVETYTFSQDYFFMMGDNRHNSLDSRYWGFVPEDHIVGKPWVIWFSNDKNWSFPRNVRWRRMFKFI